MAMTVDPGCAYFGFYSDFGDVYRGEIVTYSSAVASATADGARDVADIVIPDDLGSPTILVGHPKLIAANGTKTNIEIQTTYDNGIWGDGTPPWEPSSFLVELQGPGAAGFVIGGGVGPLSIYHYISSDGGQAVYLSASGGASLFDSLTRVKIWRAAVVPGDEVAPFWTGFVNAHEITGDGATPGGSDHPTATTVTVPFTTTLGAVAFNEALWFQATLSAGSWTFDTADSPLPENHDTCLALYNSSGVLVATNDDIDVVGGDYRSSITQTLAAGTYYLAVGGYDATVGNGFTFTGAASLIAGAVLNIAAT